MAPGLSKWKRETIRLGTTVVGFDAGGDQEKHEENLALASKARKGKGKASHFKLNSSHGGKKGDFFNFHNIGYYATNFPSKKSKKGPS